MLAQEVKDNKETIGPLDQLARYLDDDMRKVNETILIHMDSDVQMIPKLASYIIASGGKRIRPLLTLACTELFGGDMKRAHNLAASVEFIHTATLLHDDVVDKSDKRRGKDTANNVFGNQASVLVGDFLFSRAFQLMVTDGSVEILRILSEASAIIAQGEVKQLTTANNLRTTMEDYISVISSKTAALFSAACEVGPVISGQDDKTQTALRNFGNNLGIAFQIADDILDYSASRLKLGKTVGDDFREGKVTAPILISLEKANDEETEFWQRTIVEKKQNEDDLSIALKIFERHDALGKAKELAELYIRAAQKELKHIENNEIKSLLFELATYSANRDY